MPENVLDVTVDDLPTGLGGARKIQLPATRYRQGGRVQYHVNLPIGQVTSLIRRPDPTRPLPGNRKVEQRRGQLFGDYLRKNGDWVSPAIIVRVPIHDVQFTEKVAFEDGTAWGVLVIGIDVLTEILLLDGQHRTLGIFISIEDINAKIRKIRETIDGLARQGGGAEQEIGRQERLLEKEREARRRLSEEHISIDIVEVGDKSAMQMFGDINNNAKGVNRDLRTVLDQRSVVNRIAMDLIERHVLLEDRVELGHEKRMGPTSDMLLGAKAVSDIVHGVLVGTGRVGARVEDELDQNLTQAVQKVSQFLDVLLAGFTTLQEVVAGEVQPKSLRDAGAENRSMLGSVTMLRALAATYHDLTTAEGTTPMSRVEVESFFRKLEPHMRNIPVTEEDPLWWPTGAFLPGATAPQARQGSVKALVEAMAEWARNGHPAL